MTRGIFERELQSLQECFLALGSEVGDNVVKAVDALKHRDAIGARRLIAADEVVNRKRIKIMSDALVLIAKQQPMAGNMPGMAAKTRIMLRRALEASSQHDAWLARAIPEADDEIDALFNKSYRKLLYYAAANPGSYKLANYLEWALYNLERAAGRWWTRRRQNNRPMRPKICFTPTVT